MGRRSAVLATAAIAAIVVVASAWALTGTWTAYPGQTATYQASIQQPIDSGNTSNWNSKSKGAIPIMFKVSSGLGPLAFESIYSDNTSPNDGGGTCGVGSGPDRANDCAFLRFVPDTSTTFSQITDLVANYSFTLGNCHGGSLRWQVRLDVGNDGSTANDGNIFVYYGDHPNFTDCTTGTNNQSGSNMIGLADARYDLTQVGGTFYDTYANALTLHGATKVLRASLVIDSGWGGDQRLSVASARVNDNTFTPTPSSGLTPTCDLPPATLRLSKVSPAPDGAVNEEAVQAPLVDNGDQFRIVDCKYQFIQSIPALAVKGAGQYKIEILISGNPVGTAYFDLK